MKPLLSILVFVLELIALIVVARVWRQKHTHWAAKLLWSILLMVPVFGLLFYGFLTITPDAQEDHTETSIPGS
jgi:hypothetical protein